MDLLNLCQQILHDMWARKLRSLLALFGIVWGTAAVILLISLGHAFINANKGKIMNLASGTLFISSGHTSEAYRGYPINHTVQFKAPDIMKLPQEIPHIKRISVDITQVSTNVKVGNKGKNSMTHGVGRDYLAIQKIALTPGSRNFSPQEIQDSRNVIIIGEDLKNLLFGNRPAINHYVTIHSSIRFLVVGIMQHSTSNSELNSAVLIPYNSWINIWGNRDINFFMVQPASGYGDFVKSSLRSYLGNEFHFSPDDQVALQIFDTTAFSDFFKWFFMAIQVFLALCGALTLAVGGIGVANIMFLIVTERTREIGLRMAVGARDWQVLMQIVLEAIIIVGTGALIGFILAFLIISSLQASNLPSWMGHPHMSWLSVFASIIILAPIAILSGYFPGKNASRLDPVAALTK